MIKDIIAYFIGAGGIILFVLGWIRFRKKDIANVFRINANTAKVNAEAQEIRAKADVLITDGALRIVERLSSDLDEARDEIENLIKIVGEMKALHEKTKSEHEKESGALHEKLNEAKELIEIKRRHCVDIKGRIVQLRELLQLKQQGLTQEQLDSFITTLSDLINPENSNAKQ